jgi:hypothetical protein
MDLTRTREIANAVTKSQTVVSSLPLCIMVNIITPRRAQRYQL